MSKKYQRFLAPGFTPFNPLELAKETEKVVTRRGLEGLERKYVGVYSAPVYGGIATGYAVGCCLRCIYCWSNWSRDFPEAFGRFYSPADAARSLFKAAKEGITARRWRRLKLKVTKLRVSGCEPTLGEEHLLGLLKQVEETGYPFYLETNGILLGSDINYIKKLSQFSNFIYVRVSFKAATPSGFTKRTGAIGRFYELPFIALRNLLDEGIYTKAAAMTDPKVMPREERKALIQRLNEIDPSSRYSEAIEEETIDAYGTTVKRLKASSDAEFAEKLKKNIRAHAI